MSTEPATNPKRGIVLAVLGTALHAALLLALLVMYVSYIPAAKKVFDEFGLMLPWVTLTVIRISNWLCEYWWVLVPVVGLLGIMDAVLIWALGRGSRTIAILWVLIVALAFSAVGAATVYAIEHPIEKLKEGLAR